MSTTRWLALHLPDSSTTLYVNRWARAEERSQKMVLSFLVRTFIVPPPATTYHQSWELGGVFLEMSLLLKHTDKHRRLKHGHRFFFYHITGSDCNRFTSEGSRAVLYYLCIEHSVLCFSVEMCMATVLFWVPVHTLIWYLEWLFCLIMHN